MTAHPQKLAVYGGVASFYDLLFGFVNRPLSRAGVAICRPQAGMRVLDLCCGTGSHLEAYGPFQCLLFGLDASVDMLKVARRRLGDAAHLDRGDAMNLPYAGGTFDLVSCKLALHSISTEARASVLSEASRVLKHNGRLVLIDFHPGPYETVRGWIARAAISAVEFIVGGEHYQNHREFLGSGGLLTLAREQGLRIERQLLVNGGAFAVQVLLDTAENPSRLPAFPATDILTE